MYTAESCIEVPVEFADGLRLDRVPFGMEKRTHGINDGKCHDCGVLPGHFHHLFCDMESCPKCEEQFIGCDCEVL